MTTVWCAAIECEYNKENQCQLPEINLTHGHVHTVHNGFMQHWQCRNFGESARAAELRNMLELALSQRYKNQEGSR